MPEPDQQRLLEHLPLTFGRIAEQLPVAGGLMAQRSLETLVRGRGSGEMLALSGLTFEWRFQLQKEAGQIRLFFVRRKTPGRTLMDVKIGFRAVPAAPLGLAGEPAETPPPLPMRYFVSLPPFVHSRQSDPQGIVFAVGAGGGDRLHVRPAERVRNTRLWYSRGGRTVEVVRQDGRWPLEPFLALADAIRGWLEAGFEEGEPLPITAGRRSLDTEPERIVACIVASWRRALAAFDADAATDDEGGEIARLLYDAYDLEHFRGDVALQLRADGQLAETDADDPFLLRMVVDLERNHEDMRATITVGPPDFLVSGELRDAFLEQLREGRPFRRVARELRRRARADEIRRFLDEAADDASVFRVVRKKRRDRNILILRGTLNGVPTLVLLKVLAVVDTVDSPPRVGIGEVDVLHVGAADGADGRLDQDTAKFFLRLIRQLWRWYSVTR